METSNEACEDEGPETITLRVELDSTNALACIR